MSFLTGLRGRLNEKHDSKSDWIKPGSIDQFKEWVGDEQESVVIYKHSYRCGTCMFTKMRVERVMQQFSNKVPFLFIDVLVERNLSAFIAEFTGIRHESPQLIILRNGKAIWHESHAGIDPDQIVRKLGEK